MDYHEWKDDLRKVWLNQWVSGNITSGSELVDRLQLNSVKLELTGNLEGAEAMYKQALNALHAYYDVLDEYSPGFGF
ncbi:hypothetical protein K8R33_00830 [archaeon]|nr:hypothetical protein [archaeon]